MVELISKDEIALCFDQAEIDVPWTLAVSGGSDSVALMHLAANWTREKNLPLPIVLTVDHGLRAASKTEAGQVSDWAQSLGLEHVCLRWEGAKPTSSIQAQAREARYKLMGDWCRAHGIRSLLTAHTQDDQAETFLLRLARGSGVSGLSAMKAKSGDSLLGAGVMLHRPLLSYSREHLRSLMRSLGHEWIDDPSNEDEQYARIRMRKLMPLLAEEGLTSERLAKTATLMADADNALSVQVAQCRALCADVHAAGYVVLTPKPLLEAPRYVALSVLSDLLKSVGGGVYKPRAEQVSRLYEALRSSPDTLKGRTLAGCSISPLKAGDGEGRYLIVREMRGLQARMGAGLGREISAGESLLWDNRFEIRLSSESPNHNWAGHVRPLGAEGWRQMKAASNQVEGFSDVECLPSLVRRTLPSLWQGENLVACAPFGQAFRVPDSGKIPLFEAYFRGF